MDSFHQVLEKKWPNKSGCFFFFFFSFKLFHLAFFMLQKPSTLSLSKIPIINMVAPIHTHNKDYANC